jgi:hypothetical protein
VVGFGEGQLEVVAVATNDALYHWRLRGNTWTNGAVQVSGTVISQPILTAFSPTRLHLLAIGTDSVVYNAWATYDYAHPLVPVTSAPPIVWSGYNYLGGAGMFLAGVAKSGPNEMTMVGLNTDGLVMISRFTGARWTQFQKLQGQNLALELNSPRYRPAITSFSN